MGLTQCILRDEISGADCVCLFVAVSAHFVYEDPPMGALPEDEFAAVDDVRLEEDNTKTVKAAMSKLGMSDLKDELLTQLKLGHAVTMPKEHLAKFVATRAKWYRSLGSPLHIDAYDKWICWPLGV